MRIPEDFTTIDLYREFLLRPLLTGLLIGQRIVLELGCFLRASEALKRLLINPLKFMRIFVF
jgi:hypothetical protein